MKHTLRILFVDDDIDVLKAIERSLYKYKNIWETKFVEDTDSAIEILKLFDADLVISDLRMPNKDGFYLFKYLIDNYPHIVRIFLSAQQDDIRSLLTSGYSHQYITKPIESEKLVKLIDDISRTISMIGNREVLSIINKINHLPLLPDIYLKIEKELASNNVDYEKLSSLISQDMGLTIKILQLVNSSFIGLSTNISDIPTAIKFLGINIIKALILNLKLYDVNNVSKETSQFLKRISRNSFRVACIAKELSQYFNLSHEDTESIFISGILHDIGNLIMLRLNNYIKFYYDNFELSIFERVIKENEMYKINYCLAGTYLSALWGLPHKLFEPIFYQNTYINYNGDYKINVFLLNLAIHINHNYESLIMFRYQNSELNYDMCLEKLQELDIPKDFLDIIIEKDKNLVIKIFQLDIYEKV